MSMTEGELLQILDLGHETPGIEFKGPGSRADKGFFAKVARAALAMANRRGGGRIIVGVDEADNDLVLTGLTGTQVHTWGHDAVAGSLSKYADPLVSIYTEIVECDGKRVAVITVQDFEELPVLCKKNYPDILREGACYVRRRDRIESSEIPTQAEMRALLDLATERGIRRFLGLARNAGVTLTAPAEEPGDAELYTQQLEGFE